MHTIFFFTEIPPSILSKLNLPYSHSKNCRYVCAGYWLIAGILCACANIPTTELDCIESLFAKVICSGCVSSIGKFFPRGSSAWRCNANCHPKTRKVRTATYRCSSSLHRSHHIGRDGESAKTTFFAGTGRSIGCRSWEVVFASFGFFASLNAPHSCRNN